MNALEQSMQGLSGIAQMNGFDPAKAKGRLMQLGRVEKMLREISGRLDTIEARLEKACLDIDKTRAAFGDEIV